MAMTRTLTAAGRAQHAAAGLHTYWDDDMPAPDPYAPWWVAYPVAVATAGVMAAGVLTALRAVQWTAAATPFDVACLTVFAILGSAAMLRLAAFIGQATAETAGRGLDQVRAWVRAWGDRGDRGDAPAWLLLLVPGLIIVAGCVILLVMAWASFDRPDTTPAPRPSERPTQRSAQSGLYGVADAPPEIDGATAGMLGGIVLGLGMRP